MCDPKREYHRLFLFLDNPDVEPTNNHAERALRKLVIYCYRLRPDPPTYDLDADEWELSVKLKDYILSVDSQTNMGGTL